MNLFTKDNLVERLAKVSHFKGLPLTAITDIVFAGQLNRHKAGSIIFHEGDSCAGLYVIFNGHVHLYKLGIQGQESIITSIKPVIMFNEVPVLDGGANTVSAIAVQDCLTWCISRDRFHTLMKKHPELGTGLLLTMAKRNRLLFSRYEDLLSRPVIARVAKVIIHLSDDGISPINRYRYDNQKFAALAATVPEAISRSIKILKEEGIIDVTRGKLEVLFLDQLYEKAMIDPLDFRHFRQN
ncbi:MAG TPA: Crp/Fnr family transcriptional regulator [Anaerolineaceae bacterium]|nr:Crp/Fnr family transcriptional regulator [Anaerolineaceae bacterium]